jgi:hypothetical protein
LAVLTVWAAQHIFPVAKDHRDLVDPQKFGFKMSDPVFAGHPNEFILKGSFLEFPPDGKNLWLVTSLMDRIISSGFMSLAQLLDEERCQQQGNPSGCGTSRQHRAFSSNDDSHVENQVLDSCAPQIDLVTLAGSGARSDFECDGPARFGHPVSVT